MLEQKAYQELFQSTALLTQIAFPSAETRYKDVSRCSGKARIANHKISISPANSSNEIQFKTLRKIQILIKRRGLLEILPHDADMCARLANDSFMLNSYEILDTMFNTFPSSLCLISLHMSAETLLEFLTSKLSQLCFETSMFAQCQPSVELKFAECLYEQKL